MSEERDRLWRLHELDEQATAARATLAKFPEQKSSLAGRVTLEKERLAAQHKAADEQLKLRRKLEQDIETINTTQRQFESRQPLVKTNEEFRALTQEIDGCKAKRSQLETQVLERFEDEEKLAQQRPAIERALKEAEAEQASRIADIEREEAAVKTKLAEIEAARATDVAGLVPATRQRYERIHASRDGRAVVAIVKNACGGCFRAQPPQTLAEIRRGDRIMVCDGCGRIMILPPGEPA